MNLQPIAARIRADAALIDSGLTRLVNEIESAMRGQPKGQRFEPTGSGSTVLWCWEHQREVHDCEALDLDCDGETIEVHDPTGEAAVEADQARADERNLSRLLNEADRALNAIVKMKMRYDANVVIVDRAGIGTCADCPRYCDGKAGNRLSAYKGGDRICPACRMRRDRSRVTCGSIMTHDMIQHRCELEEHVTGNHRGDGYEWNAAGLIERVA